MDIKEMLEERRTNYGSFENFAAISQELKATASISPAFSPVLREGLDMILHKVARIVNGNPEYIDSYRDIVGYATLIVNYLEEKEKCRPIKNSL